MQKCPRCGTREDDWAIDRRVAYTLEWRVCHGCERLDLANKDEDWSGRAGHYPALKMGSKLREHLGLADG